MIARPGPLTEIFEIVSYVRNLEQTIRELRADRDGMSSLLRDVQQTIRELRADRDGMSSLLRDVLTDAWQSTDIRSALMAADVPHAVTVDPHCGIATLILHGRDSTERSAIDSDESMSFSWAVYDADDTIRTRMAILVALRSRIPVGG